MRAYVETVVAQGSRLMIESIAALFMRGLGAVTDGVRQGVSTAWCSVLHPTQTPTVELMTIGIQPTPPQTGFDRGLSDTNSRHSLIEIESHIEERFCLC